MLTAYFDESGTSDSEVLVVAGYLEDARRWRRFERDWSKILQEFSIPYFHMNECAHFKKHFAGWTETKRADLMGRLAFAITSRIRWSITCAVSIKDYMEVVPAGMRERLFDPYFFCLWCCFPSTLRCYMASGVKGEKVNFVFDKRFGCVARAVEILQSYKGNPNLPEEYTAGLGTLSFEDDKHISPLQAADYLAYEVNKYRRGFTRKSLLAINSVRGAHEFLDRRRLIQIVQDVRQKLFYETQP